MDTLKLNISKLDKDEKTLLGECLTMLENYGVINIFEMYPKEAWISGD